MLRNISGILFVFLGFIRSITVLHIFNMHSNTMMKFMKGRYDRMNGHKDKVPYCVLSEALAKGFSGNSKVP